MPASFNHTLASLIMHILDPFMTVYPRLIRNLSIRSDFTREVHCLANFYRRFANIVSRK